MKKIIFILFLLLAISAPAWAGHLQDMQRGVIALKNDSAGLTKIAYDNFTDADTTELSTHTSDSSHSWTKYGSNSNLVINGNAANAAAANGVSFYYSSVTPASADYIVSATFYVSAAAGVTPMIGARASTAAVTLYGVKYGNGIWTLSKWVSGTATSLGTYTGDQPTSGLVVQLSAIGTDIKVIIAGTERISVSDNSITAAGRPAVGAYYSDAATTRTIDSWEVWE